jgi:hypothetical protein
VDELWIVPQPLTKLSKTRRVELSAFGSSSAIDCHVPSCNSPATTGTVTLGATISGSTWSAPWPREPCAWRQIVARQELVQLAHQVRVRPGAQLHDHDAGRGVRHEHVQQAVAFATDEFRALARDVEQAAPAAGVDRYLRVLHES